MLASSSRPVRISKPVRMRSHDFSHSGHKPGRRRDELSRPQMVIDVGWALDLLKRHEPVLQLLGNQQGDGLVD